MREEEGDGMYEGRRADSEGREGGERADMKKMKGKV